METVSDESVIAVAEEIGVDVEAVVGQVSSEVELKLRLLVQDAAKFMRHTRRQRMTTHDIDHVLRLRGCSPILGYGYSDLDKFKFLQNHNVFFLEQEDVDLNKVLGNGEMLFLPKKVPLKPEFGIHWLAVDGVQPAIKENPRVRAAGEVSNTNNTILECKHTKDGTQVMHALSKELQIYFDKIVFSVHDAALGNIAAQRSMYHSISHDPGLQPLMRYLSKFMSDVVSKNTRNLPLLQATMRLMRCILVNPNLDKELYLHQLMPAILTCIVHKELCSNPFQDHWQLRRFAAHLLPIIVYSECGAKYENVKMRVTKTLFEALQSRGRPMTTHYGAICGITFMGPLTVQAVLIPVMRNMIVQYHKVIRNRHSVVKGLEAQQCIGAVQIAFGEYLKALKIKSLSSAILLEEYIEPVRSIFAAIGEAALPWALSSDASDFIQLFV